MFVLRLRWGLGMRLRPKIYDNFLITISEAIAAEMKRRSLTAADVAQRVKWGTSRARDLRRFTEGDIDVLGPESALKVAGVLGLSPSFSRPVVAPRPTGRLAA